MRLDTSRATSPRPRRRRAFAVVSLALLPVLALAVFASNLLAQTTHASGSVSFAPAVSYPVGANPTSVAIGDLNGDGHPDIVTANAGNNNVSVLLSTGTSGFAAAVNYSVGIQPNSVAIGNLNGDTIPDLVVANTGSGNVSVLLGTGGGAFAPAVNYLVGTNPRSVAIGHVNGNVPLIVTANAGSNNASVLTGVGVGGFVLSATLPMPPNALDPVSVAIGDFNGDGLSDFVIASGTSQFSAVWETLSTGSFLLAATVGTSAGLSSASVATGDFNGDGLSDFAVADNGSNFVFAFDAQISGNFIQQSGVAFPSGLSPIAVAVGDFNGDGHPDLVTANSGAISNVSVLLGDGTGVFAAPQNFAAGTGLDSVAVGDLNGDDKPDIVTANSSTFSVSVLLNTTSGTPTPTPTVSPTPSGGGSNTAQVTVALAPGDLSATTNAAPSLSATLNGQDQTLNYNLPITVTDGTATGNGWNLTITSTQFSTSGAPVNTLPTTASTVVSVASACASGTCVDPTNTVGYPLTIPAGTTAPPPVKLFNAAVGTGMGIFTVTPSVNILVPATTVAGTYTSTITLAIVSGP